MDSLGSVLINREIGDLIMNAASWIVLFILVMIVGFILYRIVKRTKNGMPPTCGCNCTSCGKLCAKRNQDSK